jgi:hypothetical protein
MRKLSLFAGVGVVGVLLAGCSVLVPGSGQSNAADVYQLLHGPLTGKTALAPYSTVDPCSELDVSSLSSDLEAKTDALDSMDYCRIDVTLSGHDLEEDYGELRTSAAITDQSEYQSTDLGRGVSLLNDQDGNEFCEDYLKFSDGVLLELDSFAPDDPTEQLDNMCDPAAEIGKAIFKKLSTPYSVGHINWPAGSYGKLSACSLASTDEVQSAGMANAVQETYPAAHTCSWDQDGSSHLHLSVTLMVDQKPTASGSGDQMQTIAGHDSLVSSFNDTAGGYSYCVVETAGNQYQPTKADSSDDSGLYEVAQIYIDDSSGNTSDDCQLATKVAQTAFGQLPGA